MKTKAQVIRENSNYKSLINAVISRVGMDSVRDINNNGIDGGFNGFIYYNDTHTFAMRYRRFIIPMLEQFAADFDLEVTEFVAGFGVFKHNSIDAYDRKDLYKYLGGGRPDQGTITNVMAWFAAEEVCRMFED